MPTACQQILITLTHEQLPPTNGDVTVCHYNKRQRLIRMLKWWGLVWLSAIVSVAIPVAHFVLVPLLLIAGPIAAVHQWRQISRITNGKGICPNCQSVTEITKGPNQWPIEDVCRHCRRFLKIEKAPCALPSRSTKSLPSPNTVNYNQVNV